MCSNVNSLHHEEYFTFSLFYLHPPSPLNTDTGHSLLETNKEKQGMLLWSPQSNLRHRMVRSQIFHGSHHMSPLQLLLSWIFIRLLYDFARLAAKTQNLHHITTITIAVLL